MLSIEGANGRTYQETAGGRGTCGSFFLYFLLFFYTFKSPLPIKPVN